jgi:ABC-type branched-subunit amino acid transport system ATPase component
MADAIAQTAADAAADVLLSVDGLEAGYGEVQVLWGLSLKAARGKLTAIVGANGAGKTTTLRAVAGTLTPWGGRVMLDGDDVTRVPSHVKAARGLALVPEGRQLFSMMSVAENLELGARIRRAARAALPSGSTRCSSCFRGSPSGRASALARSPAASSRWWRSRAG